MNTLAIPATTATTQLSERIGTDNTTLFVADTTGFASSGWLSVGLLGQRETVYYDAITFNQFQGVVRSVTPRSFQIGTRIAQLQWFPVIAELDTLATTANLSTLESTLQSEINNISGGGHTGKAILDFGAFPGQSDTSVTVTGQTGITSSANISAWLCPQATVDHSADEHLLETIKIFAGNIIDDTGFTIYGINSNMITNPRGRQPMPYGQWTVNWSWN